MAMTKDEITRTMEQLRATMRLAREAGYTTCGTRACAVNPVTKPVTKSATGGSRD